MLWNVEFQFRLYRIAIECGNVNCMLLLQRVSNQSSISDLIKFISMFNSEIWRGHHSLISSLNEIRNCSHVIHISCVLHNLDISDAADLGNAIQFRTLAFVFRSSTSHNFEFCVTQYWTNFSSVMFERKKIWWFGHSCRQILNRKSLASWITVNCCCWYMKTSESYFETPIS